MVWILCVRHSSPWFEIPTLQFICTMRVVFFLHCNYVLWDMVYHHIYIKLLEITGYLLHSIHEHLTLYNSQAMGINRKQHSQLVQMAACVFALSSTYMNYHRSTSI